MTMARSRPAILLALVLAAAALLSMAPAPASKYNITKILAPYKEFSKFNAMLSETRLANDINQRQTITVLAVNNAAMSALDHYSKQTQRHILSLHVLVDYYGEKKLKKGGSTALSTLFMVRTCNSSTLSHTLMCTACRRHDASSNDMLSCYRPPGLLLKRPGT
jgi:hypothetical protein